MNYTATYSPEDNKLRLYASSRLDKETYERVKSAGFRWAPKQDLFVAPMWTPQREDILLELAGEIGDEDTSLVERQEQRAERFSEYSDARTEDAEQARAAVDRIAHGIPMGQPILIGHHSEKHARKDAERIENGMRKAVKMWETATYWKDRAAGAIRLAKYKERPDVRARRIKGLEADMRGFLRDVEQQNFRIRTWEKVKTIEQARTMAGHTNTTGMELYFKLERGEVTAEQAREEVINSANSFKAWRERWIRHTANRLEYERAMLADAGGTEADKTRPEVGGACQAWCSWRGGFSTIQKVNKVSVTLLDNWGNGGKDFTRTIPFDKLKNLMSKAEVDAARAAGRLISETPRGFHLAMSREQFDKIDPPEAENVPEENKAEAFEEMKQTLRAGVQVVSAPQLFPTPPELAARMVELAEIEQGQAILEPSAGTGAIIDALPEGLEVVCVEVNNALCRRLNTMPKVSRVFEADFLSHGPDPRNRLKFDRVVMNPPFENGSDIKHIKHAMGMLKPGGRLVAICANGPRQQEQLKPLADTWEELPEGTFSGTGVHAALIVIDAPAEVTAKGQQPLFGGEAWA